MSKAAEWRGAGGGGGGVIIERAGESRDGIGKRVPSAMYINGLVRV